MEVIRGVVFDLDDTLYLERDYVASGFRCIAEAIGDQCGGREPILEFLSAGFLAGVRGDAFNRLLEEFPALTAHWKLGDLVELYRTHRPDIAVLAPMRELVTALASGGVKLALITDGPVASQSGKVAALDLERFFAPVVLTDAWGVEFRKPHRRSFEAVMENWRFSPAQLVYIGDNPDKDFFAPRALGWQTVRLRMEAQLRHRLDARSPEYAADREFRSVDDLTNWLTAVCALPPAHTRLRTR